MNITGQRLRRAMTAMVLGGASALTAVIVSAAPAHAACPADTSYDVVTHTQGWITTSTVSIFVSAPGTVTLSTAETASVTATVSASFSVTVSAFVADATAELGVSFATSVGRTQTWSYSKSFSGSTSQRAVVSKRGESIGFSKIVDNPNCTSTTYTGATSKVPYSASDPSQYCYHLDAYPASTWEATSGGCFDQS
jgi:hypothetical protein